MKDMPLLTFQNTTFTWRNSNVPLLQNINWSLSRGEAIHLDAPSGTGKTTFLKLAAGLLKPTSGSIKINTDNLGFAFQEPRLMPWLSVIENLRLVQKTRNDDLALEMLDYLCLTEKISARADTLSGGEAQRVNLIRALINSPTLLFMDEPFNGLDATLMKKSAELIKKWFGTSNQRGMIIVTHIQNFLSECNVKSVVFPNFS